MIICCTLFAVRSFAFEVRSWAGNAVPASLHKTSGISVLTRKGEVLRHCCHPLRPRSWRRGGRSQLTALSGPGPQTAQLSSLRGPGTQETQLALKALSPPGQQGPGLADCIPCRLPWRLSHRGRERGEIHRHLKAWAPPVGSLGHGSRARQDTVPACSLCPAVQLLAEAR